VEILVDFAIARCVLFAPLIVFRRLHITNIYKSLWLSLLPRLMPVESLGSEEIDMSEFGKELIHHLRNALSALFQERSEIAIAFSGGIDSSLLARISLDFGNIKGFVAGTSGSIDIRNAREASQELNIPLEEIILDESAVVDGARELYDMTGCSDPLIISFELPLFFVLKTVEDKMLVTGQGADELFGGYAKYEKLTQSDFLGSREADMRKLFQEVIPVEDKIALSYNKFLVRPFLSLDVLSFTRNLPINAIYPAVERKRVVREALSIIGLDNAAAMKKKAAQYGSGIAQILKKTAKKSGKRIGEFIRSN